MRALVVLALLAVAAPAAAQTPPALLGDHYVPAPWWMRDPVIASTGYVRAELPANRASFSASFQVVGRSVPEATKAAGDKVMELGQALRAFGQEKVQVETIFTMRPLYEQYRDKEGNLIDNQRSDKIERYEVNATVSVRVRNTELLEQVYGAVLDAHPTSTSSVDFSLEPSNEQNTWLYSEAVKDASRRAKLSAEAAGAKLGAVKIIDPSERSCETDVFAGWPSYEEATTSPTTVQEKNLQPREVPPPPLEFKPVKKEDRVETGGPSTVQPMRLPLQPPLQELTAKACVVYGLAG
jgi:uncharacterized protein YggE